MFLKVVKKRFVHVWTLYNALKGIVMIRYEDLLNQKLDENTQFIVNSGRYEFKNKGIDLFIDSLAETSTFLLFPIKISFPFIRTGRFKKV